MPPREAANFMEMISYCRPEGSRGQTKFCNRYLRPVFGGPDPHGNYVLQIGSNPNRICFMAHHDTVHRGTNARQEVLQDAEGFITLPGTTTSACLGADCTSGVWLILEMIRHEVPGLYIIHASEECGGYGSQDLVKSNSPLLQTFDVALSFDRMGYNSIITHQGGRRTASEEFSQSLAAILKHHPLKSDDGGTFTDSANYADVISECSNLSVGYFKQHSKMESQDGEFLVRLRDALIAADWSKLKVARDPKDYEYIPRYSNYTFGRRNRDFEWFIQDNSDLIADWLHNNGIDEEMLRDELGLMPKRKSKTFDDYDDMGAFREMMKEYR